MAAIFGYDHTVHLLQTGFGVVEVSKVKKFRVEKTGKQRGRKILVESNGFEELKY